MQKLTIIVIIELFQEPSFSNTLPGREGNSSSFGAGWLLLLFSSDISRVVMSEMESMKEKLELVGEGAKAMAQHFLRQPRSLNQGMNLWIRRFISTGSLKILSRNRPFLLELKIWYFTLLSSIYIYINVIFIEIYTLIYYRKNMNINSKKIELLGVKKT